MKMMKIPRDVTIERLQRQTERAPRGEGHRGEHPIPAAHWTIGSAL
jgi:hypothetical protein